MVSLHDPQETEEVYEVDGTFVHRSRMTPLPGAGIAEEASIPGVPLKAAAKVGHRHATTKSGYVLGPTLLPTWRLREQLRTAFTVGSCAGSPCACCRLLLLPACQSQACACFAGCAACGCNRGTAQDR